MLLLANRVGVLIVTCQSSNWPRTLSPRSSFAKHHVQRLDEVLAPTGLPIQPRSRTPWSAGPIEFSDSTGYAAAIRSAMFVTSSGVKGPGSAIISVTFLAHVAVCVVDWLPLTEFPSTIAVGYTASPTPPTVESPCRPRSVDVVPKIDVLYEVSCSARNAESGRRRRLARASRAEG